MHREKSVPFTCEGGHEWKKRKGHPDICNEVESSTAAATTRKEKHSPLVENAGGGRKPMGVARILCKKIEVKSRSRNTWEKGEQADTVEKRAKASGGLNCRGGPGKGGKDGGEKKDTRRPIDAERGNQKGSARTNPVIEKSRRGKKKGDERLKAPRPAREEGVKKARATRGEGESTRRRRKRTLTVG